MQTAQAKIKISGMTCDHCVKTVEKGIRALQGVNRVKVDLATQSAEVAYAPDKVTPDQIKKAITDAGYQVMT
jgi:copper ion binding protein